MGHILISREVDGVMEVTLINESEEPELYDAMLEVYDEWENEVWFQWPTEFKVLTQAFGNNPDYYGQFKCGGVPLPGHEGLDMRAFHGSQIFCCYDGKVSRIVHDEAAGGAYGIQVRVEHMIDGVKYETTYAHLQMADDLEVGDEVKKGQFLGLADSTGNSTASHLHLTLKRFADNDNGWPCFIIDPTLYFKELQ